MRWLLATLFCALSVHKRARMIPLCDPSPLVPRSRRFMAASTSIPGATFMGCPLTSPNQNGCACPKWIYAKARDGKAVQQVAGTPSFTEACQHAQKILKGFDPEIRAAREITTPALAIPIEAALDRYLGVLRTRGVTADYLNGSVWPTFFRRAAKRRGPQPRNLSLLEFLDRRNLQAASPVLRMDQLSSSLLEDWAASWISNDLSSSVRRTLAMGFLKWAVGRDLLQRLPNFGERRRIKKGNRCGYFSGPNEVA
jgi:hypothetical protein